jgi:hypothetical protein
VAGVRRTSQPGGWLTTTAGNRAIDRIRREKQRDAKHDAALMYHDDTPHEHTGPVEDDRLRLLFTCCHPALTPEDGTVTDGSYPETKEVLGGFAVVDVPSREEALEWAAKIAAACRCAQEVRELLPDPTV